MNKFCFLLTFLISLLSISINANSLILNAAVDRSELADNESLRLIITADENSTDTIDFTELLLQFDIINTQRSNQTSVVNGKVSANTQWILILSPKDSGELLIPAFEYRGAYSQAISIIVDEAGTGKAVDKDAFLQLAINKSTVYVQEQILVTIRLYYKTALSSYDDEVLRLENTTITLVSENNFRSNVKGVPYNLFEKTYALHPQSSGEIIIPTQSWRLEKAADRFDFGRSGNPYLYVRSAPVTVNILPIANTSTADTWLPSTAVTLDAKWKQSIIQAKLGEPLNYQLILIANGLTAAQLPEISLPNSDKFTIYSDQPTIDNDKSSAGITGTRINNFAIIPREIGIFTFPGATAKWWNTSSNKEVIATIAPQKIVVVSPKKLGSDKLPALTEASENTGAKTNHSASASLLGKTLTSLFAISSLLLAYILFTVNKRKKPDLEPDIKKQGLNTVFKTSRKQLMTDITNAINNENWDLLRTTLLQLGRHLTHKKSLNSLNKFVEFYPELRSDLRSLDSQVFGKKQKDENYRPEKLLIKLSALKEIDKNKQSAHALKNLYTEY
ncbi:MAG: hypothetical protein ACJAUP_000157 [Cellvibrionaceae bacterium]|jgi:hypothetical protein